MATRAKLAPGPDPLLTPQQVAERIQGTPRQVRRWMEERRIRFVELPKGRRIPESALREFLDNRTIQADG